MSIDPIRQRWRDLPAEAGRNSSEALAGDLFRAVPSPRLREPQAVSSLFAELRERRRPFREALRRVVETRPTIRRLAVAFSVFLSLNLALALALPQVRQQIQHWRPGATRRAEVIALPSPASPLPAAAVVPTPAPPIAPPSPEPSADGVPGLEAPALSRPQRHVHAPIAARETTTEPSPPAPIAADSDSRDESLAGESQLLSKALASLSEGQPAQALATLALYQEKYPHGSMGYEVALAQVKAEMANNQVGPALAAIERAMAMPGFEGLPRSNEITVMRAELLAQSQRCTEAVPIFDRLAGDGSSNDVDSALVERALYGRARCLASEGDAASSHAALHDYLRRFPSGRFAKAARGALAQ
jgi:TolA-binding protein